MGDVPDEQLQDLENARYTRLGWVTVCLHVYGGINLLIHINDLQSIVLTSVRLCKATFNNYGLMMKKGIKFEYILDIAI